MGFFHEMTRSTEYGERLYSNTVTSVPKLGAIAASWNASDTCVTTGYKACFQFLFGPQCPYEPYMIIHARHAEQWVVECTINGETRHIYSPFEFRVAYINEKLPVKDRLRRSVYLIFLEPSNDIRPYATHMTASVTIDGAKTKENNPSVLGNIGPWKTVKTTPHHVICSHC